MDLWLGKDRVELHYFGKAHTAGDIVVYVPEQKVAFIGDLYFQNRPQLIHSMKDGNSFAYVETLNGILENLDAETFISGHGNPVGRDDLSVHILAMQKRQEKVKELVGQEMDLEEVLSHFEENESRLVTSIYQELADLK
jgi:glyoxylase-like metal-dependent hydrolase (beta-lactamase superfamily II)